MDPTGITVRNSLSFDPQYYLCKIATSRIKFKASLVSISHTLVMHVYKG